MCNTPARSDAPDLRIPNRALRDRRAARRRGHGRSLSRARRATRARRRDQGAARRLRGRTRIDLRRFEQEARAIGALNHPNILGVHDIGSHEGAPYVVSELLEGETLRARIGNSPLPQRKALDYAAQIASGLAAAHDRGIVHRDLKPENLFVTRDGRVKILDFGLAKLTAHRRAARGRDGAARHTRRPLHERRHGARHGGLHVARAGARAGRRSPLRHLLLRRRALRDADGPPRVPGRLGRRNDERDPQGGPAPAGERGGRRCRPRSTGSSCTASRRTPRSAFSRPATWRSPSSRCPDFRSRRGRRAGRPRAGAGRVSRRPPPAWLLPPARRCFLAGRSTAGVAAPTFEPLTFRRGTVTFARFAPDGRTIVYAASFEGGDREIYTTQPGSPESRPLGVKANLQAVSRNSELAILLERPGRGAGAGAPADWWGRPARGPRERALRRLVTRRRVARGRADRRRARQHRISHRPRALPGTWVAERRERVPERRPRRLPRAPGDDG